MKGEKMQDLQQKIIRHYGLKKQKDMLYHALSDLAAALIRGKDKKIKEDIAKVLNLLEQIIVFQDWEEDIYRLKYYEINRTLERIKNDRL